MTLWMTGLSIRKSTIANAVEKKLTHELSPSAGWVECAPWLEQGSGLYRRGPRRKYSPCGRSCKTDDGCRLIVTAFISPFRSERQMVWDMMATGEFVEVFVDTPLSVAEERDVKGLYAKARSLAKNFGIDSPYGHQKPQKSTSTQPQCQSTMRQSKSSNSCLGFSLFDISISALRNFSSVISTPDRNYNDYIGTYLF